MLVSTYEDHDDTVVDEEETTLFNADEKLM